MSMTCAPEPPKLNSVLILSKPQDYVYFAQDFIKKVPCIYDYIICMSDGEIAHKSGISHNDTLGMNFMNISKDNSRLNTRIFNIPRPEVTSERIFQELHIIERIPNRVFQAKEIFVPFVPDPTNLSREYWDPGINDTMNGVLRYIIFKDFKMPTLLVPNEIEGWQSDLHKQMAKMLSIDESRVPLGVTKRYIGY